LQLYLRSQARFDHFNYFPSFETFFVPKLFFKVADPLNYRNYELKLSEKCAKMKDKRFW